jgi:hypothetical protein
LHHSYFEDQEGEGRKTLWWILGEQAGRVDETNSGLCPVPGFGTSSAEPPDSRRHLLIWRACI